MDDLDRVLTSTIVDTMAHSLTAARAHELVSRGGIETVDTRDRGEWSAGHPPGARRVPPEQPRRSPTAAVRGARGDARATHVRIENAVRAALAGARPSLDEILSLWPAGQRDRIVLRARLGADGGISTGALLREQAFEAQPPDVARDVRRIRNDVPVILELDEVGTVVIPMRALETSR